MPFVVLSLVTTISGMSPQSAWAAGQVSATGDAIALGRALVSDTTWVTGAELVHQAGPTSSALVSGDIAGFPLSGQYAAMLSTGNATTITQPNSSGSTGTSFGGPPRRGNTDRDVTVLRVDLNVPQSSNCLVGLDFRFLSEEYPEWVGSSFNDAFIAELDRSTWTTSGSTITAPDNFAFDPTGNPVTINAAGQTSMKPEHAEGTTFDGATPLLTAATPLTPGAHSLYLSIFDQGDTAYDSAVIVDNLRLGHVGDPATQCKPGAKVVDKSRYVALGDSYSSGFGVSPYYAGTHKDAGPNDCQRSTKAYGPLVADLRGLDLDFNACQGAVTKDFLQPRNSTWGEVAQLEHLREDTGVVTFSAGGNDAKFADVLAECILGMELLPFNTCYDEDKVTQPVAKALARLDNTASTPADVVPYDTLYRKVRQKAPIATAVMVGYPHFYTADGGDRTWLPGGRCEGVKKVDQRWMVEKIDELNGIIERNARAKGFLYAEPDFSGHELCSGGEEWIFGLLSAGKIHPKAPGHAQIAEAVVEALDDDGFQRFTVLPQKTVTYSFEVGPTSPFLSLSTGWPGSDVVLTLRSPSGKTHTRGEASADSERDTGPTYEIVRVTEPEAGTWTAELYGADVATDGEETTLSTYVAEPENQHPHATIATRVEGGELVLDASGSTDEDGTIAGYDWYVSTAADDEVLQGRTVRIPLTGPERAISLVVTDDGGLTDFAEVRRVPVDVKPGSDVNPITVKAKGVTPVAFLSTETFDATTIDPRTVTAGPAGAPVKETSVKAEDVDGDGRMDQVVHVATQDLGVTASSTQLCLKGTLSDGDTFTTCDGIRAQ